MSDRTLTRVALEERLLTAQPGDRIIYHVGHLGRDRKMGPNFAAIDNTGLAAVEACNAGKVHLAQHRVMPDIYEYVAIVKGTPACGASSGA